MQNITRTLTDYEITAYDLVEDENGIPAVQVVAECRAEASSMTKSLARAELSAAVGKKLQKGLTVKWRAIGSTTYAMPLDRFLESAIIIKKENDVSETPTVNVQ